jgi:UDP-glucose 4-epimerase
MILITGGLGFIGLHTARACIDAGETVVLTQFHVRREPDFIKGELGKRATVDTLDVLDADRVRNVIREHNVDGIIHLAVPGLGALTPTEEYKTNMDGLINILDAAKELGVKRVSLASSIGIYANVRQGPLKEEMPLPVLSTGSTEAYKKGFEVLGLFYGRQVGLDTVALRIGGIYGPLYHSMANLPSRLTHAAVRGTEPQLSGRGGGPPLAGDANDMTYVKDCAQGIQKVHMAAELPHNIYNIGSGRASTNGELADAVNKAVPGANIKLPEGASGRAGADRYLDLEQISADVGYKPEYDVYKGVADYAEWLRHNEQ